MRGMFSSFYGGREAWIDIMCTSRPAHGCRAQPPKSKSVPLVLGFSIPSWILDGAKVPIGTV
jgi:hypothetical protein